MLKMINIQLVALFLIMVMRKVLVAFIKYLDHSDNKLKGIDHIFKKSDGILLGMCLISSSH